MNSAIHPDLVQFLFSEDTSVPHVSSRDLIDILLSKSILELLTCSFTFNSLCPWSNKCR